MKAISRCAAARVQGGGEDVAERRKLCFRFGEGIISCKFMINVKMAAYSEAASAKES